MSKLSDVIENTSIEHYVHHVSHKLAREDRVSFREDPRASFERSQERADENVMLCVGEMLRQNVPSYLDDTTIRSYTVQWSEDR